MSYKVSTDARKNSKNVFPAVKPRTFADRNARRGGYNRNAAPGDAEF